MEDQKITIGLRDDYCDLQFGDYYYYYGVDEQANDHEWCFVAKKNDKEVWRATENYLVEKCGGQYISNYGDNGPEMYLLAGIVLFTQEALEEYNK